MMSSSDVGKLLLDFIVVYHCDNMFSFCSDSLFQPVLVGFPFFFQPMPVGEESLESTHTICYGQHICMACNCSVVDDPFFIFGVIFSNTLYWWLHSIPRWWACRCNPLMLGAFTRGRLSLLVSCYVVYLPVPEYWLSILKSKLSIFKMDASQIPVYLWSVSKMGYWK